MTSLGIFNEHIPHTNLSAASTVSDQPSPLTDTHLNTNNFRKQPHFQPAKGNGAQSRDVQHRLHRSYLHMKM